MAKFNMVEFEDENKSWNAGPWREDRTALSQLRYVIEALDPDEVEIVSISPSGYGGHILVTKTA